MRAHFLEQPSAQHRHRAAPAGAAARVGAAPRLDREAARLARRVDAEKLALESLHRRNDPLLQAAEPLGRAREARIGAGGVAGFHHSPRTRFSIRSTWAIGVSGRMPWPRLKMWARSAKPASTRSTP